MRDVGEAGIPHKKNVYVEIHAQSDVYHARAPVTLPYIYIAAGNDGRRQKKLAI